MWRMRRTLVALAPAITLALGASMALGQIAPKAPEPATLKANAESGEDAAVRQPRGFR